MKKTDRTGEREYQDCLNNSMKSACNAQLQPLRSLRTATKKRRALKKKTADISGARHHT
jgi:hypothetical protein